MMKKKLLHCADIKNLVFHYEALQEIGNHFFNLITFMILKVNNKYSKQMTNFING